MEMIQFQKHMFHKLVEQNHQVVMGPGHGTTVRAHVPTSTVYIKSGTDGKAWAPWFEKWEGR